MTDHDLTIRNAHGEAAVMVTITPLGIAGSDELADHAADALTTEFADSQVEE